MNTATRSVVGRNIDRRRIKGRGNLDDWSPTTDNGLTDNARRRTRYQITRKDRQTLREYVAGVPWLLLGLARLRTRADSEIIGGDDDSLGLSPQTGRGVTPAGRDLTGRSS